jgi:hypothetical protein
MKDRRKSERRKWVGKLSYPFTDSNGILVTKNRRRVIDRRVNDEEEQGEPVYPFTDSSGELVTTNRRRILDRRTIQTNIEKEPNPSESGSGELMLTFQQNSHTMSRANPRIVAGRRKDCDIRVVNKFTSREHARFEMHSGSFFITDQSTNGTYLMWDQGDVVRLSAQELPLTGSGVISLGCPISLDDEYLIRFECQ